MVVISLTGTSPGSGWTVPTAPTQTELDALKGVQGLFPNAQLYGND